MQVHYLCIQCFLEFLHVQELLWVDIVIGEVHQQAINIDSAIIYQWSVNYMFQQWKSKSKMLESSYKFPSIMVPVNIVKNVVMEARGDKTSW